ncbi:60S acidic ribosomal protein P1 [Manis javanica]|nr:60S acidic ribosomal protein P1 [Manis javanica]
MVSVSELTSIYLAPILHYDEAMVTESKINALITAACVNAEPFWPGLSAKALASANMGSLISNRGAGGATGRRSWPLHRCCPAEEPKMEAKKEASAESDDDKGFGIFD